MSATPKPVRKKHKAEGKKMADSHISSLTPHGKSRMSEGTVRRKSHKLAKGKSLLHMKKKTKGEGHG